MGLLLLLPALGMTADPESFPFQSGDHISIVGNTLADRMQHDGWLEALLQRGLPDHRLSVRDLGFSGDELTIRLRSSNFGSPDEWLKKTEADVVFAFFGYNESFAGEQGLPKFKQDLDSFLKQTKAQQYNGSSSPRIVLFSPIAHENLNSPHFPDGSENNHRLAAYTAAMAEVAAANDVRFVDLFHPSQELYEAQAEPLTINGVHLNELGNRLVAEVIVRDLLGGKVPSAGPPLDKVRAAVQEKNFYWFNRYRTTDGYSIYGGRADLKFVDGQTNREVMQREMEVLDVMTANRDLKIWGAAQGRDVAVDDSNTPPFIPVVTNKPGAGPNGEHLFLTGEKAIELMTVAQGMKVELVASEEMFPELINPVQMAFDTKGRLVVAAWESYPHWKPKEEMNDKLLILKDTNGDGKADECKTFADKLHNPTGFEFWGGGVLVSMPPDILFLKDTNGDDVADLRISVLHGIDSADTHHAANSFTLSPGGALYFQEGTFHHTQIESPWKKPVRSANAGVFRFEPLTSKIDCYVAFGFANPHGHVFDRWGQDFVHDGTGAVPFHATLFSGHLEYPAKHNRPPTLYNQRTRPCPATEILSSAHFPPELQGNLLVGNVIGFQGILQYKFRDNGASFGADEMEPILSSTDPNFRPVDLEIGPDGALYFVDWQNPIIGHMQHNLRDPSRDRLHGRVYRVTYPSRPLVKPVPIAGEPLDALVKLLESGDDRVRARAKIEISGRFRSEAPAAVKAWLNQLDPRNPDFEHRRLEALWVHQYVDVVDLPLLESVLKSPDPRARAAAVKVLCDWRDRITNVTDRLLELAADEHPKVRLEVVRAASFLTHPESIEIPLVVMEQPTDEFINFVHGETLRTLEPIWNDAVSRKQPLALKTDAGRRYFLKNIGNDELVKQMRDRGVYLEMLYRDGLREEYRQEAIGGLARLENKSELAVLLGAIQGVDGSRQGSSAVFDLVRMLTMQPRDRLLSIREELVKMAKSSRLPIVRQIGYVALIAADGSIDPAWEMAGQSANSLVDLVNGMPLIPDPSIGARLYAKVAPLLDGLPPNLASSAGASKGTFGRFVRIELPGNGRTLTLAEVEVLSGGVNLARSGKATQSDTSHGGDASKAIDGNKNPSYGGGGQTHTPENRPNPWWEVDLLAEHPIESIAVFNRNEGDLGNRLNGFTLKVLNGNREVIFEKTGIPAPQVSTSLEVGGGGSEAIVRRAAMNALVTVRGQESETFKKLASFVLNGIDADAAIVALQRIPRRDWPQELASPLADAIVAALAKLPADARTSPSALNAMQLGDSLASLVPIERAREIRKQLGELGVRVIRIGTVPHQMAYDRDRMVIQAGKPVEFLFENSDIMPHNFVIAVPGTMAEIGMIAEMTAQDPDAAGRHYVPKSKNILLSGRLLQNRESERLTWTAPSTPGVYPYVCTYPGHWRRMYGALYVVGDVDAYEANPEEYIATAKLEIKDDLLKFNRPRKDWKFEELAELIPELGQEPRSFGNGKQMFSVANCVACHRMNNEGIQIGQDLTQLDREKMPPLEILRHVLEPSLRIDDKFATNVVELASGKVLTGIVVEETESEIKLVENPLLKAAPLVIDKGEIVERAKSKTSIMPAGLLSKLSHNEILDLIAYVVAKGNDKDPLFSAKGHHQH